MAQLTYAPRRWPPARYLSPGAVDKMIDHRGQLIERNRTRYDL